ncbi:hypothetical protein Taro_047689 [Colocasia esculenta]|uniref:Argonaute 2 n=1 Tax=Colocasia esculenta TaxID=4460 RepID=A0A843X1C1_COLES|nr:hypothetical protein [Colocasia esculenta]
MDHLSIGKTLDWTRDFLSRPPAQGAERRWWYKVECIVVVGLQRGGEGGQGRTGMEHQRRGRGGGRRGQQGQARGGGGRGEGWLQQGGRGGGGGRGEGLLQQGGRGGGGRGEGWLQQGGRGDGGASAWQQVGQPGAPGGWRPTTDAAVSTGGAPPPTWVARAAGGPAPQVRPAAGPGGERPSGGAPSQGWVARPAGGGGGAGGRGGRSAGGGRGDGRGWSGEHPVAGPVPASLSSVNVTVDSVASDLGRLDISSSSAGQPTVSVAGRFVPIQRPDRGGLMGADNPIRLRVNHFLLNFDDRMNIYHYDISVKSEKMPEGGADVEISKRDFLAIKTELFNVNASQFQVRTVASDGVRDLFIPRRVPEGDFNVVVRGQTYHVTLKLQKLIPMKEFRQPHCPRDILHGLDVIMRENASRGRISVGRNFFSDEGRDLGMGIVALSGFQQSVKSTEYGPVLNVDQSVMAFHKPMMILDYLKETCRLTFNENTRLDVRNRKFVKEALHNLKVEVIHRAARKKYTIFGLTEPETNMITFRDDQSERNFRLVDYYAEKYGFEIKFKQLPCLKLSRTKENYVPMELCKLAEGQIYPKDRLPKVKNQTLREMAMSRPQDRVNMILGMINSANGPARGDMLKEFSISVSRDMAKVTGRILERPVLKLSDMHGRPCQFQIWNNDCQWNLLKHKVALGKRIEHWGIADFSLSANPRHQELRIESFVPKLVKRCCDLGILMNPKPAFVRRHSMDILSYPYKIKEILNKVKQETGGHLQILICPMADKHDGYKSLKLIAETEVGILTQCCLSSPANEGKDQYLANLGLKMNAKLGGSNIELFDGLPCLGNTSSPFMFIGADVNHPRSHDITSPSIAAVVATVNWPASNSYISKVQAQPHRKENIVNIGSLCRELIDKYSHVNKTKPQKIIYFRDGVSDSQFDMVLNGELTDIKDAIESDGYKPTITVVVAQKRHQTRLFPEDRSGPCNTRTGNVPPGTVVDTGIVAPHLFNFYLCSHNGILGTSKPTHYYVLWDEHRFTSDELQKLTYDLCFTFNRCTKPVSLVPPVYYADLLAYRGRQYYEALVSSHDSSSSSSSSSSNFPSSFDSNKFPEVLTRIENAMIPSVPRKRGSRSVQSKS